MDKAENLFTQPEKDAIVAAIQEAEHNTSGEIRVHLENYCKGDVLERATVVFEKLQLHKTQLRNGVLFYVAIADRKFAILGDAGINQKTPENFWDSIKETMLSYFHRQEYTQGLVQGIQMAGQALKQHFPYQLDDVNELPDEISFGTH